MDMARHEYCRERLPVLAVRLPSLPRAMALVKTWQPRSSAAKNGPAGKLTDFRITAMLWGLCESRS